MKTIAEIGNDRLINVLVRDKNQSPARILNILKSEITELIRDKMKELRAQIDEIVERYGGSLKKYERAKADAVCAK